MSARAAALPMYGINPADVDRFWRGLAAALADEGFGDAPETPDWPEDLESHWRRPDLLLSQTCGYPLVEGLDADVTVVGAFRFSAPGANGIDYSSFVVVRDKDAAETLADLRGRTAAINSQHSHSGANALRALVAPLAEGGRFFGGVIETGAHRASIDRVREGEADVAAVDCVSFALIQRHEPAAAAGLRILTQTASAPGLPLITAGDASPEVLARLRRALSRAVADPSLAEARAALFIAGFEPLSRADYEPITALKRHAVARGYPELA